MLSFNETDTINSARALADAGNAGKAFASLEAASAAGSGEAAIEMGDWLLEGRRMPRDLTKACEAYRRAAFDLGAHDAIPLYLALLVTGPGDHVANWALALDHLTGLATKSEWAARQIKLISSMHIDASGSPEGPAAIRPVVGHSALRTAERFLSRDECHYLIEKAFPLLGEAVVIDPCTGLHRTDPVRRALTAALPLILEDPVTHAINRRIARLADSEWDQGEPAQVIVYRPGDEYRLHSDVVPGAANQRVRTVLVLLNDGFEGGETVFPRIGYAWRGRQGDALVFDNLDSDGLARPEMLHAGAPVVRGQKALLSRWIRARTIDLGDRPQR